MADANPETNNDATLDNFSLWPQKEVERIGTLSDHQVIAELQQLMVGNEYSWHTINYLLQEQVNNKTLEFTLEHGDIIFEWNNLCDERREWEKKGCFSVHGADFNRDCLVNLKIIPIRGGLGNEGQPLY